MSSIESQLLELLPRRRDNVVRIMAELSRAQAQVAGIGYGGDEVEQMANGFLAVLAEELEGGARQTRTFYLETLIPALLAAGSPLRDIIGPAVAFAVATSFDLADSLPPASRVQGAARLAKFWGEYAGDLAQVGVASR